MIFFVLGGSWCDWMKGFFIRLIFFFCIDLVLQLMWGYWGLFQELVLGVQEIGVSFYL